MGCITGQSECNKVVTVRYLKSLCGSNIQDSGCNSLIPSHSLGDNYCPTYSELTGGTVIQNHKAGSGGPIDDVDGIIVSGTYAPNQMVRQKDVSMAYTRFKSLTISTDKTTLSECGTETATLSFTNTLTRTTKSMDSSTCSVSTTAQDVNDTRLSLISFTQTNSDFTISKPTVSVSKNDANASQHITTPERKTTITGHVNFRCTQPYDSDNTVTVTQKALTGSYYTNGVGNHYDYQYTALTASVGTSSSGSGTRTCSISGVSEVPSTGGTYTFSQTTSGGGGGGVSGGDTAYSCSGAYLYASAVGTYYERFYWIDSCGTEYRSAPFDRSSDMTEVLADSAYISTSSCDCCDGGCTKSHVFTFNWHNLTKSVTGYCKCSSCGPCITDPMPTDCENPLDDDFGDDHVYTYEASGASYMDSWKTGATGSRSISSDSSWAHATDNASGGLGNGYVQYTIDKNTSGAERTAKITFSYTGGATGFCTGGTYYIKQKG